LGSGNFGGIIGVLSTSLSYIWYVRSDNIIYGSTNNGASWFKNYTAPSGNYKHITYSREQGTFIGRMWGVRDNGGITLGMIPLPDGISIISELIPSEFKLSQNYPNPFNPTTNFEFQIAKQGFTALKIYDILGREVTSLVNEELKAGTYKAVWNAETYPSGIYFAVLTAGGMKFTRKIALIK
jgi:hypothetical protein